MDVLASVQLASVQLASVQLGSIQLPLMHLPLAHLPLMHGACAVLALLMAIALLSTQALNPLCARILGGNYVLFSMQHVFAAITFSELAPQLTIFRATLAMLLGPALFVYFISVLSPEKLTQKKLLLHLLPVLLMVLVLSSPYWFLIDAVIISSFLAYPIYLLFQIAKAPSSRSPASQAGTHAMLWLRILIVLMCVNALTEVGIFIEMKFGIALKNSLSLTLGSAVFFGFYWVALVLMLIRSPILEWMHELKFLSGTKTQPITLTHQQLAILFERWQELVKIKQLHLIENGITLARAARLLGVPAKQLSQAINTIYEASFSQYLNDVRVDQAQELLLREKTLPITEVYLKAGFSTKSHFHREFTKKFGITPSEYRKNTIMVGI